MNILPNTGRNRKMLRAKLKGKECLITLLGCVCLRKSCRMRSNDGAVDSAGRFWVEAFSTLR